VTFLGQAEEDERKAAMLEEFRKRQRRLGLKPLPRYVPSVPPPNDNEKIKKGTK
jgi:hypothetical protein